MLPSKVQYVCNTPLQKRQFNTILNTGYIIANMLSKNFIWWEIRKNDESNRTSSTKQLSYLVSQLNKKLEIVHKYNFIYITILFTFFNIPVFFF